MKIHKLILLIALINPFCGHIDAQSKKEDIDSYITRKMKQNRIPGLSLAVIKNKAVIYSKAYGYANMEWKIPATINTVFEIGSITKVFTSFAIFKLIEDGKINPESPLSDYLAECPPLWKEIKIKYLLPYLAGIPDYINIKDDYQSLFRNDYSADSLINRVASVPVEFKPGEGWDYCNTCYFLLGLIIEKLTGQTYADYLNETIFKPLSMKNTMLSEPGEIIPYRAQGYIVKNNAFERIDPLHGSTPGGAGGLISTLPDLIKFLNGLENKKILKPETYKAMWRIGKLNDGKEIGNNMGGWEVYRIFGHRATRKSGRTGSFTSEILILPDKGVKVVVLTNVFTNSLRSLIEGIADHYVHGLTIFSQRSETEDNPILTQQIKTLLVELGQGNTSSALMVPELKQGLIDKGWTNRLKNQNQNIKEVKFIRTLQSDENRFNIIIKEAKLYRMKTKDGIFYQLVFFSADYKVVDIDTFIP